MGDEGPKDAGGKKNPKKTYYNARYKKKKTRRGHKGGEFQCPGGFSGWEHRDGGTMIGGEEGQSVEEGSS